MQKSENFTKLQRCYRLLLFSGVRKVKLCLCVHRLLSSVSRQLIFKRFRVANCTSVCPACLLIEESFVLSFLCAQQGFSHAAITANAKPLDESWNMGTHKVFQQYLLRPLKKHKYTGNRWINSASSQNQGYHCDCITQ